MNDKMLENVQKNYGKIAKGEIEEIISLENNSEEVSKSIGYSLEEIESVPEEANVGLGCGNPFSIANIKEGDIVLDLGSGAGFDCFLASKKVGRRGRVIGVDMTPEMLHKARRIAKEHKYRNVEFRLGEIENLPVADNYVDVIISNCVINLSSNKGRVYNEMYRVLMSGGTIAISDIVIIKELSEDMRNDELMHSCWVSGASSVEELKQILGYAKFKNISIDTYPVSEEYNKRWGNNLDLNEYIMSAKIRAEK